MITFRQDAVDFPKYETVFDYYVDGESGQFTLWEDNIDLRSRPTGQGAFLYTPIHQFERYSFICQCLLAGKKSVMLVGEQGCGKTSLVKNLIQPELELTHIAMASGVIFAYNKDITELCD